MNKINMDIMDNIINAAFANDNIEETFIKILETDTEEALNYCENGLKETKNSDYAIYLGHTYLTLGEYEKAIECVDIALRSGSNYYVYAYNVKGESFLNLGMYIESRESFEKVLEADENQLLAKEFLLELDLREEKYSDAIKKCKSYLIEYNEDKFIKSKIKSTLGWIYMDDVNEPELAEIAFEESLKIDRNCARAYTGLGILHMESEKYREAIVLLEKAKDLEQEDAENYFMIAMCHKALEDFELIEELLLKAIICEPEDNRILLQLAFEMNRQERYFDAIECFNKLLILNPDDDYTWNDMGDTYQANNQFDEALECYIKAYEIDNGEELYSENINKIKKNI